MSRKSTGGTSFDYLYEGKHHHISLTTTNEDVNFFLELLRNRNLLEAFQVNDTTAMLLIRLSMNLNDLSLKSQIRSCISLYVIYKRSLLTPDAFPKTLHSALSDCFYEDKLQVFDRRTQIKLFTSQVINDHPDNTNTDAALRMMDEAEGFLAFCSTEDLDRPGDTFNAGKHFNTRGAFEYLVNEYRRTFGITLSFCSYGAEESADEAHSSLYGCTR
ncbi:MAG: hypothetical protein P1U34_06880 [Coxiellaceae bacterium]|nr:hypothetical protein [Coxiellaceae bacterium]